MLPNQSSRSFRDYLTIKAAAAFLGVSPDTLRNWDETGKLPAIRHPVNGYRLYNPRTLEALLARTEEVQLDPEAVLSPRDQAKRDESE